MVDVAREIPPIGRFGHVIRVYGLRGPLTAY